MKNGCLCIVASAFLGASMFGYQRCAVAELWDQQRLQLGALALLGLLCSVGIFLFLTREGRAVRLMAYGASKEWKRVSWPTRKEALSITMIVLLLSLFSSALLWGVDTLLARALVFIGFVG